MSDKFALEEIRNEDLSERVKDMRARGYMLSMITVRQKTFIELIYTFEKNYELLNLCIQVSPEDTVQSVCKFYPYSYIYENEAKELFGVKITGMDVDFKGNLYKLAQKTPLAANPETNNE
jgi:ech hydrogenase subunit D